MSRLVKAERQLSFNEKYAAQLAEFDTPPIQFITPVENADRPIIDSRPYTALRGDEAREYFARARSLPAEG